MSDIRILQNKFYLYLTEFFSGMAVMAVELGASRLLAPYFSSSQIVWTIIIGTIMIAMALGNIYGGRSADKNPNPDFLYIRMLTAAVWIAVIPALGKYVILGISALLVFSVNSMYLVWAAFAACMVIFVYPLFLLGTVTPSLAKYSMDSLDDSGSTVGRLGAANTIGSIIGTFVPTFVTIPAVGTSVTFLIFACILFALAAVYFISRCKGKGRLIVSAVLIVAACVFGHSDSFAFWEDDLAYEGESVYNYLQVKEDDERVILSTNVLFGVQSVLTKDESLTGMYYDYAMAAPLMAGWDEAVGADVLILGMGSGTYATQCSRYFGKNIRATGVEIDGKITSLARTYFELPEGVEVYTYDGRAFLNAVDETYDVIMVDAYQDITIPFQMASEEFFTLVKEHLNPGGVMVVNMNMRGREDGSINAYLQDTIASVFGYVYTADVARNTNRELFASDSPDILEKLDRGIEALYTGDEKSARLGDMMTVVRAALVPYEAGGCFLTDDKAPVELLSMRAIDALIADEVTYYKGVYESDGLGGLMEQFG